RLHAVAARLGAVVDEVAARDTVRRVARRRYFDAPLLAKEVHALRGHHLRATGEERLARREVEDRRGEAIDLHLRVALDARDDASRLLLEREARRRDRIAANVHDRAATDVEHVADVARIEVEIAEVA